MRTSLRSCIEARWRLDDTRVVVIAALYDLPCLTTCC